MTKSVLVTGATGSVGTVLVPYLLSQGYRVRSLVRDMERGRRLLPEQTELIAGLIENEHIVDQATQGADIVLHLAAKLHINDPPPNIEKEYYRVNVTGTENVIKAALKYRVERVLHFSTISVYGPSQYGTFFDEQSPFNPDSYYAKTKVEAEKLILENLNGDNTPAGTILRLSTVYGPHMKGNYVRLMNFIEKGIYIPIGKGINRRTLIYEEDLARAVSHMIQNPQTKGEIYNVTDGQVYKMYDLLNVLYELYDRQMPKWYIPKALATAVTAIGVPILKQLPLPPIITKSTVKKLTEDVAINGDKLKALGFTSNHSLQSGWQQAKEARTRQKQGVS